MLIKAIENSVYPKLLSDDLKLFQRIIEDVFTDYSGLSETDSSNLEVS